MDLRVFVEPQQGASYDQQLRVARAAEELGYSAFFRSDHFLAMGGDGQPGPTDAWVTLGALARETSTIRLGTMVTSATFRQPGVLAVTVAQVDDMSGGRVEFGLGTGWFQEEHEALGIPFPPVKDRFDRLEEQLAVLTGLWTATSGQAFDFDGAHYTLRGNPGLPKPVQTPHPPIIVGGAGARRTPALAARYAAEYNVPFASATDSGAAADRVREACRASGRNPEELVMSVAQVLCCGRDDAEVARRAAAIGRDPAELRENGLAGTPAEVVDKLGAFAELGFTRVYLQTLDLDDVDHLELVASEVAGQLR